MVGRERPGQPPHPPARQGRAAGGLVGQALEEYDFRQATAAVWAIADEANRFVNRARPWELARAERDGDAGAGQRLDAVLGILFEGCRALGRELEPFLPDAAERFSRQSTPRDGRLPAAAPVFRRLSPGNRASQYGQ